MRYPITNDAQVQQLSLDEARAVIRTESEGLEALALALDGSFAALVDLIQRSSGRVILSGVGKSAHMARKTAATLASTGTPAQFVHGGDASHGDLGMITAADVVLMLSNSGETDELVALVPHVKRAGAAVVALTGNEQSSLAQSADIHLDAGVDSEACPLGLAPTASTTAVLALGDALALALLDQRGFSAADFMRSHPGGALGRRLVRVAEVMRTGPALPVCGIDALLPEVIAEISRKEMGMAIIVDDHRRVAGIFTEGDLRRCLTRASDIRDVRVADVMTRSPRTVDEEALAIDCVEIMETPPRIMQLVVADGTGHLVGALHMHDLFKARIV